MDLPHRRHVSNTGAAANETEIWQNVFAVKIVKRSRRRIESRTFHHVGHGHANFTMGKRILEHGPRLINFLLNQLRLNQISKFS